MLFGSKSRSAPRSEASSIRLARASRSDRRRRSRCAAPSRRPRSRRAMRCWSSCHLVPVASDSRSCRYSARKSSSAWPPSTDCSSSWRRWRVNGSTRLAFRGEVEDEIDVLQHHRGRERRRVVVAQERVALVAGERRPDGGRVDHLDESRAVDAARLAEHDRLAEQLGNAADRAPGARASRRVRARPRRRRRPSGRSRAAADRVAAPHPPGPETTSVRFPLRTTPGLPLTGERRNSTPASAARSATRSETATETVLMSMSVVPRRAPASSPARRRRARRRRSAS